jgi:hypothetical protein
LAALAYLIVKNTVRGSTTSQEKVLKMFAECNTPTAYRYRPPLAGARRRTCERCRREFVVERSTGRFCSVRCRVANHRDGHVNASTAVTLSNEPPVEQQAGPEVLLVDFRRGETVRDALVRARGRNSNLWLVIVLPDGSRAAAKLFQCGVVEAVEAAIEDITRTKNERLAEQERLARCGLCIKPDPKLANGELAKAIARAAQSLWDGIMQENCNPNRPPSLRRMLPVMRSRDGARTIYGGGHSR